MQEGRSDPIAKKGRPYIPEKLLCIDCKLLSKTLASRLVNVMEQIIHSDQSYCVPGRTIFDNIYVIRDVLDVSRLLGLKLV